MKSPICVAVILLTARAPAAAHRLDEYLQGTLISLEKNRVNVEMTLTPGVAVFPVLIEDIDLNADGAISETEQSSYATRVLHDLSIAIDGRPLAPLLLAAHFPSIADMKEGRGEIQIEFTAALPSGGDNRKLTFENHHQSRIAAFQVNCLVPRDPAIRILAQNRNYTQSFYELHFAQPAIPTNSRSPMGTILLILFAWIAFLSSRPRLRSWAYTKWRSAEKRIKV